MTKPLRALFHYFLALTMLFASSFAMFHASEHLRLDNPAKHVESSFAPYLLSHDDHVHHQHSSGSQDHEELATEHAFESLCEACLIVSSLTGCVPSDVFSGLVSVGLSYKRPGQQDESNH
ncbi:hypothetical protein, partial [Oleiphilus sp. HI0061]